MKPGLLRLKRRSGYRRKVAADLREALERTAGREATPADKVAAIKAAMSEAEWAELCSQARGGHPG